VRAANDRVSHERAAEEKDWEAGEHDAERQAEHRGLIGRLQEHGREDRTSI
jgi:hypothetical protein